MPVHAFNAQGERLHGKFDPATLAPLSGGHGYHDHGRAQDGLMRSRNTEGLSGATGFKTAKLCWRIVLQRGGRLQF
jgi:hypothetical protein